MPEQIMILPDGSGLLLVHFIYQSPEGLLRHAGIPLGPASGDTWKIACAPGTTMLNATENRPFPYQRSDDVRAVTCPLCKDTDEFKRAKNELQSALRAGRFVT